MSATTERDNWTTTYQGQTRIEVAFNPFYRRWEPIWPEDEGYDEEQRIEMVWSKTHGRYMTIPD